MSATTSRWQTSIAIAKDDDVLVRGYSLRELVGRVSYIEMVCLLFTGELPTPSHRRVLDAVFVSLIEHGISPSTMVTRILVSCGTPSQAAIAGGALSIADWHGGAGERLGALLADVVRTTANGGSEGMRTALAAIVSGYRASKQQVEGFGHPQHSHGDPRAAVLLDLAIAEHTAGNHQIALQLLADELSSTLGRPLHPNVNGAMAAILLDLGFPWRSIRGLVIAARSAGLAAHAVEELEQGGRWRHAPDSEIEYTGLEARPLET